MARSLLTILMMLVIVLAASPALAMAAKTPAFKIPVFWGTNEKIVQVADFPDTKSFQMSDGTYVDAGYRYTSFELFWLPIWNYDEKWAGYVGRDDQYVNLSEQQVREMAARANVPLPDTSPIPLWDQWGGKGIIALIVLALVGMFMFGGREQSNAG